MHAAVERLERLKVRAEIAPSLMQSLTGRFNETIEGMDVDAPAIKPFSQLPLLRKDVVFLEGLLLQL